MMPKDDFMWFLMRKRESVRSCIVTMRCCDEEGSFMVYRTEYPPQENCNFVMEALIMANNVYGEDVSSRKVGIHHSEEPRTEKLAVPWRSWGEQDWPVRQAVTSADVNCGEAAGNAS